MSIFPAALKLRIGPLVPDSSPGWGDFLRVQASKGGKPADRVHTKPSSVQAPSQPLSPHMLCLLSSSVHGRSAIYARRIFLWPQRSLPSRPQSAKFSKASHNDPSVSKWPEQFL